jgi:hypothetical protein
MINPHGITAALEVGSIRQILNITLKMLSLSMDVSWRRYSFLKINSIILRIKFSKYNKLGRGITNILKMAKWNINFNMSVCLHGKTKLPQIGIS